MASRTRVAGAHDRAPDPFGRGGAPHVIEEGYFEGGKSGVKGKTSQYEYEPRIGRQQDKDSFSTKPVAIYPLGKS
jgi:hypothetical protein